MKKPEDMFHQKHEHHRAEDTKALRCTKEVFESCFVLSIRAFSMVFTCPLYGLHRPYRHNTVQKRMMKDKTGDSDR
jgi:hypothetical protein